MSGQAVITGANAGIGRETALALARQGFDLVLLGRSEHRTRPVLEELSSIGADSRFVVCDLASLRSVAEAASAIDGPVALLVNNAGVGGRRGVTADGFELAFGVNHLGHHLLTRLLLPRIEGRVVTVASHAHHGAKGIDWEAVGSPTRTAIGWREYQVSKLANILFSRELARRTDPERVRTFAVHPGMVSTGIWRLPRPIRNLVFRNLATPAEGADTPVWCATAPELDVETGGYYSRRAPSTPSAVASDAGLAAELWDRSERWVTGFVDP